MIIKPQLSKFIIVAILMASYSGIYVTDFLCSLDRGYYIIKSHTHENDHHDHPNADSGHVHNHSDSHVHDENSGEDDCCKDVTNSFILALPKIANPSRIISFEPICNIFILLKNDLPKFDLFTVFVNRSYNLPPPKIPDKRVFLQSFLI